MAKWNGFTDLLQKLKFIRIEQDDEVEQAQSAPRRTQVSNVPSVYESTYARSRGETAGARNGGVRPNRSRPQGQRSAKSEHSANAPVARPDTVVYYISSLSECSVVIKDIIAGVSAVINFDGTDDRTSQRIIDTLAGAAFALNAKVRKITENTYLIAPKNVNVNMSRHIERRY
ncbi:MAG: cell division protein SepF [Clostridia bacterium]|nr:cell division protein SepF [Clostridia bacterium]